MQKREQLSKKEQQLFRATELILQLQLLIESIEDLPKDINRLKLKSLSNQLIKVAEPLVEKHYDQFYKVDEPLTASITAEYENLIKLLAQGGLDKRIYIGQCLEAHNLFPTLAEKQIQQIIIDAQN